MCRLIYNQGNASSHVFLGYFCSCPAHLHCWVTSEPSHNGRALSPTRPSAGAVFFGIQWEAVLKVICRIVTFTNTYALLPHPTPGWRYHDSLLSRKRQSQLSTGHLTGLSITVITIFWLILSMPCTVSLSTLRTIPWEWALLFCFHRWGNQHPGMVGNLPEVTLLRGGAGIWIEFVWLYNLCTSSLCLAPVLCCLC